MKNSSKIKKFMSQYLEISGPEKKPFKFEIADEKVIFGRLADVNDIVLNPDPQKLVTRHMHCSIELKNGVYWIIDNDSKNGTFYKRDKVIKKVQGEIKLTNHDLILILAKINSESDPEYWEIQFNDPLATNRAIEIQGDKYIEYDWIQAKLFLFNGSYQNEIEGLSPLEHKLLRYMDQRNKNNNNVSVMCTYEELISSIWDEFSETHTKNEVNHLVWGLRKKIEDDLQKPKFLQNIRGMGYSLIIGSGKQKNRIL